MEERSRLVCAAADRVYRTGHSPHTDRYVSRPVDPVWVHAHAVPDAILSSNAAYPYDSGSLSHTVSLAAKTADLAHARGHQTDTIGRLIRNLSFLTSVLTDTLTGETLLVD
jgi:hypothetical protein